MRFVSSCSRRREDVPTTGTRSQTDASEPDMMLLILGTILALWALTVAVVVALCVTAARGDRETARRVRSARAARPVQLKLIA
jgi:hypothetical protein